MRDRMKKAVNIALRMNETSLFPIQLQNVIYMNARRVVNVLRLILKTSVQSLLNPKE